MRRALLFGIILPERLNTKNAGNPRSRKSSESHWDEKCGILIFFKPVELLKTLNPSGGWARVLDPKVPVRRPVNPGVFCNRLV